MNVGCYGRKNKEVFLFKMVEQTTRNESSVEANIEDKVLNTIRRGNNPLVWEVNYGKKLINY